MADTMEPTRSDLLRRLVLATQEAHYKVQQGSATVWPTLPTAIVVQEEANILRLDVMWLVPEPSPESVSPHGQKDTPSATPDKS